MLQSHIIPQISVVITTYNRANLLVRAIESVLQQSFTDFELIIVDDGSTDNTTDIIKPYLQKYGFIRLISHKNRKQPLSLNTGIQLSQGIFITFLDSDDEYLPNHLALRFAYLQEHQEMQIIHGGLEIIGNPYVPDKHDITQQIHLDNCVAGGTIFGYKSAFLALGGFIELPYSSDSDLIDRAILMGLGVARVNFPTYRYYRDTADSICNNLKK
jgi:glycosyltransferase involved in cell wall biosynthesis